MYMKITDNNFITIQIHEKINNLQVPLLILHFFIENKLYHLHYIKSQTT